ncbi:MAG: ABC transporter ATP-binding protein [Enterococcus hirae]|nr:ABC transporter ATP-binding protein [Enterococcus hirae]MDY5308901.1 ABC transporter ATP-binding protein [Enterococcus hirae]
MAILELIDVSKSFGEKKVLNHLSLTVKEKTIFGFIGKNGAGKTTTMKLILGLLKKDAGTIKVNDETVHYGQTKTNRWIGYLPDIPMFYDYLTAEEYLQLCGEITEMPKHKIQQKTQELLALVGLAHEKKRIRTFSRGMKQRLGIAQGVLNEPKLFICDEPTSALDPLGRKEILDILLRVKEQTTILFSTHILSDVEQICDEVAFLNKGEIVLSGTVAELKTHPKNEGFEIQFPTVKHSQEFLSLLPGAIMKNETLIYPGRTNEDLLRALSLIVDHKLPIQSIHHLEPSLEQIFMEVVDK